MAISPVKATTPTSSSAATSVGPMNISAAIAAVTRNPQAKITIVDSANNIRAQLGSLKKIIPNIIAIQQFPGTQGTASEPTVLANDVTQYGDVLSKAMGFRWIVADTTVELTKNIDALSSRYTVLKSITSIDKVGLQLGAAQAINTQNALIKLTNIKVEIRDYASNIAAACERLSSINSVISGLTLPDPPLIPPSPPISNDIVISAYTAANSAVLLQKTNIFSVVISDTAANISNKMDGLYSLNNKISAIKTTGGADRINVAASKAIMYAPMFSKLGPVKLSIHDTSANISWYLDNLATINDTIGNIVVSPNPEYPQVTLTSSQLKDNSTVIAKISGNYQLTITKTALSDFSTIALNPHVVQIAVSDTSANISASLDTLAYQGGYANLDAGGRFGANLGAMNWDPNAGKLKSIEVNDTRDPLQISAYQASTDWWPLTKLNSAVTVSDISDQITQNLIGMQFLGSKLTKIMQEDDQTITINATDATQFYNTLSKVDKNDLVIKDTMPNLTANLSAIKKLLSKLNPKVDGVDQNGKTIKIGTGIDQVPYLNLVTHGNVWQSIDMVVGGDIKAEDAEFWTNANGGGFTVNDTTQNIASNLENIAKLGNSVVAINEAINKAVTTPQSIKLNMQQFSKYAPLFDKFTSWYNIAISDTSKNIAQGIDSIIQMNSHLSSITQTGLATPLKLTAAQNKLADNALSKMKNPYTVARA